MKNILAKKLWKGNIRLSTRFYDIPIMQKVTDIVHSMQQQIIVNDRWMRHHPPI